MIHEERVVPREKISPVSLINKETGFFSVRDVGNTNNE